MCSQDQELFENIHKISPLPQCWVESSGEKGEQVLPSKYGVWCVFDFLTNRFSQPTESPGPRIPIHFILSVESKF